MNRAKRGEESGHRLVRIRSPDHFIILNIPYMAMQGTCQCHLALGTTDSYLKQVICQYPPTNIEASLNNLLINALTHPPFGLCITLYNIWQC
jgi:hypothetical protein